MEKNHENTMRIEEAKSALDEVATFDPKEQARVIRKLDLHLLPLCFILYTFSVLDRSNLGNARTAGLEDDIDISGNRYHLLGVSFYVAYIVFQFSSLGWKLFKPHLWVPCAVVIWGTVSTLQASTSSWGGLMACRFILGMAETMFGPGVPLYLSFFYPREYMGLRFGIFLSGSALANAYGGALAYGISHAHSQVAGWRLLFISETSVDLGVAAVAYFFLPDRPETARFLNVRERQIAATFAGAQPSEADKTKLDIKRVFSALAEPRNWLYALANFSTNVSFASLPLFLPTIISDMGSFDDLTSNGLSAPPYLLCFFVMIGTAFLSDRLRVRGPLACFFATVSAVGYVVLATTSDTAPRYLGVYLVVLIFVTVALVLVWNANNNETESKRAGGVWLIQTVGQCGTVLGTNLFPDSQSPYYRQSMWIACAFACFAALCCAALSVSFWMENKRRDRLYGKVEVVGQNVDVDADEFPAEARVRYVI